MTLINVTADAVATTDWLATTNSTLVVPVYQRHYRWGVAGCERLLNDLRAVARMDAGQTHFLGSILYTATSTGGQTERMLVDGQQRVTTLMLLVAAIRDTFASTDEAIAGALHHLLRHPTRDGQPRLKLRNEGERELTDIVFGPPALEPDIETETTVSNLYNNYQYFLDEVRDDAMEVWAGLQKVVHVAITLRDHVNPQQVFESLNSTGTPLRNHELIHNYILMGLTDQQQTDIEESYWLPVEENTGDAIDAFFRDYLIFRTGRDSDLTGDRGVYEIFRKEFPAPRYSSLTQHAAEWKAYSEVYGVLLDPSRCADSEVAQQLRHCNTFGTTMYPFLLGLIRDYQLEEIDRTVLLEILEQLQSLYLRRMVVGLSRDHLAAQLCRKRQQYGYPVRELARGMPTDERILEALKHNRLPHAGYVLRRIEEPHDLGQLGELQIEHIFPQFPSNTWSGDGVVEWETFGEAERALYRQALSTIGNLALLEPALNAAAGNKSFLHKTQYYKMSGVPSTSHLAGLPAWDLEKIAERTRVLSERFLQIWKRPGNAGAEAPDHLVPVLDVQRKPSHYKGWKTEFEYVQFQGEVWEVRNTKELFQRTYRRLWETHRNDVLEFSSSHDGPVFRTRAWASRWERLGDHYLFIGMFPQYMLASVQDILDELDMADEVFVVYTASEDEF